MLRSDITNCFVILLIIRQHLAVLLSCPTKFLAAANKHLQFSAVSDKILYVTEKFTTTREVGASNGKM
jgi:hypothetical protein